MLIDERERYSPKVLGVSAFALQFAGSFSFDYSFPVLGSEKRLRLRLGFLQFLLRRRCNLMAVVMVVVARSAADFSCLPLYQRHNRVIRDTATLYTMIVDNIA
jgi:hypothetical protein